MDQTATLKEDVLSGSRPLSDAVDEFERELIMKALQRTGFNQTKAAALLGTSRRILKYRIEKLKIHDPNEAEEEMKLPTWFAVVVKLLLNAIGGSDTIQREVDTLEEACLEDWI